MLVDPSVVIVLESCGFRAVLGLTGAPEVITLLKESFSTPGLSLHQLKSSPEY